MTESKRVLGLLCSFFIACYSYSQVNIQLKSGNPYKFVPDHAWSLIISNSSGEVNVRLTARLARANGGPVFHSESEPIRLKKGINSLSSHNVSTASLIFSESGAREWLDINNTLPPGNYKLCIQIRCETPDCNGLGTIIGNDELECFDVKIELPTPLLLNYPMHEDSIFQTRPPLNWIQPTPGGQHLTYRLRLYEKSEGRGCPEIVQTERPLMDLSREGISGVPYPPDLDELKAFQSYCWHVEGYYAEEKVCQSEVWLFTVKKDSIKKAEDFNYIKLKSALPKQEISVLNILRVIYKEEASKSSALKMKITDTRGRKVYDTEHALVFGDNYLNIDLRGKGLKPNQSYVAVFTGDTGMEYRISFQFDFTY